MDKEEEGRWACIFEFRESAIMQKTRDFPSAKWENGSLAGSPANSAQCDSGPAYWPNSGVGHTILRVYLGLDGEHPGRVLCESSDDSGETLQKRSGFADGGQRWMIER